MDQATVTHDLAVAGRNTAPPIALTLIHWVGNLSLPDLVSLATLVYILLQIAYLLWKWTWPLRRRRHHGV